MTAKKILAGLRRRADQPGQDFFTLASVRLVRISSGVPFVARREGIMTTPAWPAGVRLESLEVGATPLVRHFLQRLQLPALFA